MKNLVDLNVARLHHSEAGQLVERFFEDFTKAGLNENTDTDFEAAFSKLRGDLPNFNAALDQVEGSEETKNIVAADRVRDARLQALRDALKAFRNTDDADEEAAYTALNLLLGKYKGVEDNGYEEETNRLQMLAQRLQSAEYADKVAELGLGKFVTKLAAANTAFNDVFAKRSHQTVEKVTYDVKQLRQQLMDDYRKLANFLAANAPMRQNPFYAAALKVLNNGRTYFSDTILARRNAKPKAGGVDATK